MSYTLSQQPDEYSLSYMVKDFIIASTEDILFEIYLGATQLLSENYTPDASGTIYTREIGKFMDLYLSGADLGTGPQPNICAEFTVKINGIALTPTFKVIKFKSYATIAALDLYNGTAFLNILKNKKIITRTSTEYITCKLTGAITAFVTYLVDNVPTNSDPVTLDNTLTGLFTTLDVSFYTVSALFPTITPADIVAISIQTTSQIQVLMVDRGNYVVPLNFRFRNSFDVPETIVTRGNVTRKGVTTFDTGKIIGIENKFNILRADTFEVNSGKIFSLGDYDRYREMLNSEDVEIYYVGKWCKIIIAEENTSQTLRSGNLTAITFTFRFADTVDNRYITGDAFISWILQYGKWQDDKMWLDNGEWIDDPV